MNNDLTAILNSAILANVFPGAVLGFSDAGKRTVISRGHLTYDPSSPAVTAETVYDVASVTKSIPVNALIMQLVEQGRISLDDKVILYLPEIDNEYRETMLIRHLMTYTVVYDLAEGLGATAKKGSSAVYDVLFHSPLKAAPGTIYFYTNAPAILLGLIIERVLGKPLDQVATERFFEPLGMTSTTFHAEKLGKRDIAPTEITDRGEIVGQVHDETAWALRESGLIAGNAGVFSTAGDLLTFCDMLLGGGELNDQRYFDTATIAAMHTNQLAGIGQAAGLGWEMGQERFMGTKMSTNGFGKTGFTGSLVLIDPDQNKAMVLLSNRTYPDRPGTRDGINEVRAQAANLIFG
ncbi:beta-lactamase family protein [Candidatus Saccharibacteria bacterium]|nr:beta-lactamase family protein [Candidatus Saccharibacteria bacterium]